jgi:hypothetical protein
MLEAASATTEGAKIAQPIIDKASVDCVEAIAKKMGGKVAGGREGVPSLGVMGVCVALTESLMRVAIGVGMTSDQLKAAVAASIDTCVEEGLWGLAAASAARNLQTYDLDKEDTH